jgi:hypothetical protein
MGHDTLENHKEMSQAQHETEKISKYILKLFAIVCTKQKLAQFELESLLTVNTNSKSEEESRPKEI